MAPTAFEACSTNPAMHAEQIPRDIAEAQSLGISGTPSFVIGNTTATGVDGVLMVGAMPYAAFDAKLKSLLSAAGK